jgi:NTP pyrophosphatase (non-canonical NTP hydrolase)
MNADLILRNHIIANAIDTLCDDAHANAVAKGWWDESEDVKTLRELFNQAEFSGFQSNWKRDALEEAIDRLTARNLGEQIALMHSELSEALEWERKCPGAKSDHIPEFTGLEEEFADVLIRICDTSAQRKLRLGEAVIAKMEFNSTRPKKHNKHF